MFKNSKILKMMVAVLMLFSLSVGAFHVVEVKAAEKPVLVAKHTVNGQLVNLPEGTTATSKVTIVSNVPVIFYLNGTSVSDGYSTSKEVGGTGSFTVYGTDANGNMSDTISFKVDAEPATISSVELASGTPGLTTVNIKTGQKALYYVVNGVKQPNLTPAGSPLTLTQNGSYTVKGIDEAGRETNTLTFTIPTTGKVTTTTTTTTKKVTTTKKPNTTNPGTTPGSSVVGLSLIGVENGAATNKDVTIEASEAVYFIVNGVKESKTAKALTLSKDGTYTVSAVNSKNVKSEEYTFTIDRVLPELTLEVANLVVEPGIFDDAVTIKSSKAGIFSVNDVVIDATEKSEMVISESGTYTIKVTDAAGNEATVNFVVNMPEIEEPIDDGKNQSSGGLSWLLYVVIGMVAGVGICGAGFYFLNRKKNQVEEDDEEEEIDE